MGKREIAINYGSPSISLVIILKFSRRLDASNYWKLHLCLTVKQVGVHEKNESIKQVTGDKGTFNGISTNI